MSQIQISNRLIHLINPCAIDCFKQTVFLFFIDYVIFVKCVIWLGGQEFCIPVPNWSSKTLTTILWKLLVAETKSSPPSCSRTRFFMNVIVVSELQSKLHNGIHRSRDRWSRKKYAKSQSSRGIADAFHIKSECLYSTSIRRIRKLLPSFRAPVHSLMAIRMEDITNAIIIIERLQIKVHEWCNLGMDSLQ